jgi:hypothetical protein
VGIDIQLRNESGTVLAQVNDLDMVLSRATGRELSQTQLLEYLVPWGDAVFNQAQADDLARDVARIVELDPKAPLSSRLAKVEPLISRLASETHLYLWFVGD